METRRQSYQFPIFGSEQDIKDNVLPTYEDVMKYYEWNRLQLKISRNTIKKTSFLDIAEFVSQKREDVPSYGFSYKSNSTIKGLSFKVQKPHQIFKKIIF